MRSSLRRGIVSALNSANNMPAPSHAEWPPALVETGSVAPMHARQRRQDAESDLSARRSQKRLADAPPMPPFPHNSC